MPITAKELSHTGFIYKGFPDKVHCPWSKLIFFDFDRQESTFEEHVKHSKGCLYLQIMVPESILEVKEELDCFKKISRVIRMGSQNRCTTHAHTQLEKVKLIP